MLKLLKFRIKSYSCNYKKNTECNKRNCAYNSYLKYGCNRTMNFKYAKKNPINVIKKLINILGDDQ